MNDTMRQAVTDLLWPNSQDTQGRQVHWVLDGARDPDIEKLIRASSLDFECLFSGQLHPRLQAAAPYLVRLLPGSSKTMELIERGWGNAWGILVICDADTTLSQLRLHLKKFLRVKTEEGKTLAFRYYDPRVLNVFLPTCTADEFRMFIGPIACMIAETEQGAAVLAYKTQDEQMRVEKIALAEANSPAVRLFLSQ